MMTRSLALRLTLSLSLTLSWYRSLSVSLDLPLSLRLASSRSLTSLVRNRAPKILPSGVGTGTPTRPASAPLPTLVGIP